MFKHVFLGSRFIWFLNFRNCHKDDNKLPDWQSAVESEKKASRLAIVESLLKCPLSKYFFKSDMLVKFKSDDTFTKSSSCDKKVQNTDDFERSNHELLTTELDGVKKEEEEAEREMQKTLESLDKQNVQKTNPEIASSSSSSNKLETFGNKTCSPIRQHSNLSLVNKVASPESIRAKEALFSGRPILTKAIVVPLKFCLNGSLKTPPYEVRDLPFSYYEKHYDLKRCSIVVERFKEKEIPIQEPRIKECVISVNDIKHHSWWGPKVTQLCGAEPKNSEVSISCWLTLKDSILLLLFHYHNLNCSQRMSLLKNINRTLRHQRKFHFPCGKVPKEKMIPRIFFQHKGPIKTWI